MEYTLQDVYTTSEEGRKWLEVKKHQCISDSNSVTMATSLLSRSFNSLLFPVSTSVLISPRVNFTIVEAREKVGVMEQSILIQLINSNWSKKHLCLLYEIHIIITSWVNVFS